ncbi:AB hydrolase superfamily protein YfhM [Linum grandiflorum]
MDGIHHRFIQANGLNLHYAEAGSGDKVVVFLHGFPEIWYSWRHQMIAAADSGLRALAPDYRGYGLSDPPPEPERTKYMDLIGDLHEMLKALGISKVNMGRHWDQGDDRQSSGIADNRREGLRPEISWKRRIREEWEGSGICS